MRKLEILSQCNQTSGTLQHSPVYLFIYLAVLGFEPKALCVLHKHPTMELNPGKSCFVFHSDDIEDAYLAK